MANNLYITTEIMSRPEYTITMTGCGWYNYDKKELRPEKIIFNDRTTIVIWNDGSKTKSTCSENDIFDEQIGLASCLLKKVYGKKVHGKKLFERMLASAERHSISKTSGGSHSENIIENRRSFSKEIEKVARR